MGTYVIGDVHGCYTQFIELKDRIESRDANARFILVGDLISRGSEDEKMLAWAFKSITLDGKYQMVLGNHEDNFIEVFGKGEFETVYSLSRLADYNYSAKEEEFSHLKDQELMYQYAAFLAKQPTHKKVEVNGKKYVLAHAWHGDESNVERICPLNSEELKYHERFDALWYRDREEYNNRFKDEYMPLEGERLIHGHSPTLGRKVELHRGYSPGKVWRRKHSVNIDCGLVFHVKEPEDAVYQYGNLAAFELETEEVEYLWDITDGYALNDDEYYEDKVEREQKKQAESVRKYEEAVRKFEDPYIQSFYEEVFKLEDPKVWRKHKMQASFNFLNDYMPAIDTKYEDKDTYDFDFENEFPIATLRKDDQRLICVYNTLNSKKAWWSQADAQKDFKYKTFVHNDVLYLLGLGHFVGRSARVTVHDLSYSFASKLVDFKIQDTPDFRFSDGVAIFEKDNIDDKGEAVGYVKCEYYNRQTLFTVKLAKLVGDAIFVEIQAEEEGALVGMSRVYSGW